jgi:hypothetical protein
MSNHHVKMFVDHGKIVYIHHKIDDPSNDEPGESTPAPTDDQVRFVSKRDGPFSIEFKTESPFRSNAGRPGHAMTSLPFSKGDRTSYETLKPIAPALRRRFSYTAKLAGITDDPEIIIDNSGGGGGGHPKRRKGKKRK